MGGWSSRAPDIVDALVQRFTAWPDLAGVVVRDGPAVADDTPMELLSVGYTGVEGEPDIDSQALYEGMGAAPDREACQIKCALGVLDGSTDAAVPRTRAYQLLRAVTAAIGADRTLGGVVMRAGVTSAALTQSQTNQGAQALIVFTVETDGFTSR